MEHHRLHKLVDIATNAGASAAAFIKARQLVIDASLAQACTSCPHHGQGAGCPPHVEGPAAMRNWCLQAETALAVRLDVPAATLLSEERAEAMRLLHRLVVHVELTAIALNYPRSRGFAGGSCRHLFCREQSTCLRLTEQGTCRNPLQARSSMSGFGIDVAKMMESAGWQATPLPQAGQERMSWLAGLVLVAR